MQCATAESNLKEQNNFFSEILYLLNQIMKIIDQYEKNVARIHGISHEEIVVLKEIFFHKANTTSSLIENLQSTPYKIVNILNSLVESNLIVRIQEINDKRSWIFELTDSGEQFLTLKIAMEHIFLNNINLLPEGQQKQILSSLQHLQEIFCTMGG